MGVMGRSLAQNFERNGYPVIASISRRTFRPVFRYGYQFPGGAGPIPEAAAHHPDDGTGGRPCRNSHRLDHALSAAVT